MSAFEAWFVEQHGKRPSNDPITVLADEVSKHESAAHRARHTLRLVEEWEMRYTSALYAWNAREPRDA